MLNSKNWDIFTGLCYLSYTRRLEVWVAPLTQPNEDSWLIKLEAGQVSTFWQVDDSPTIVEAYSILSSC